MRFNFVSDSLVTSKIVTIRQVVVGGWTGRDKVAIAHHIEELAAIGVPRPLTTPIFYRVSISRLTTADRIQTIGETSSGEVEYVLLQHDDQLWVGVASDHTDREAEKYGITVAKQLCDKPVASTFWRYSEVMRHWDSIQVRSFATINGSRELYQEGTLSALLDVRVLLDKYEEEGNKLADGTLMFGGTVAALDGIRFASRFEFELYDPKKDRKISHAYDVETLPILG